jgi:hypothetical protein
MKRKTSRAIPSSSTSKLETKKLQKNPGKMKQYALFFIRQNFLILLFKLSFKLIPGGGGFNFSLVLVPPSVLR